MNDEKIAQEIAEQIAAAIPEANPNTIRGISALIREAISLSGEQNRQVTNAANELLARMDLIEASSAYRAIWESAFIHGSVYNGLKWDQERDALRKALAALPSAPLTDVSTDEVEDRKDK